MLETLDLQNARKSCWDVDLLRWCNDQDIVQGASYEKFVAPSSIVQRNNAIHE